LWSCKLNSEAHINTIWLKRVLEELNMEMARKIEALNRLRDIRDEHQKQSAEDGAFANLMLTWKR
jgi:hypothetical protein